MTAVVVFESLSGEKKAKLGKNLQIIPPCPSLGDA